MTPPADRFRNVIGLVEQADKYVAQMARTPDPQAHDLAENLYFATLAELHQELHELAEEGVLPVLLSFLETWAQTP